jgi:hypothetical protein
MMSERMIGLTVLLLSATTALALDGSKKSWTFENDATGSIAQGFTNEAGEWKVVMTDEGKALAQVAERPNSDFNVALVEGTNARDMDLSVKIRAIAGKNDQGGGLVWRAKDGKNYYVARFNHLEDNLRVYKVVDGKRSQPFQNADVNHHDGWTTLRVTMKGDRIECYIDGKKHLDVTDPTFPDAGKIGLWSKSDARTHFKELTLAGE